MPLHATSPWRQRFRRNPVVIELWYALKIFGLRDRLRCPWCHAVGTWKPHGTLWERRLGDRPVRRWMCKWCGYYNGPEPERWCSPGGTSGVWEIRDASPGQLHTPRWVVEEELGRVNPWHG
jgi:hypothetical protein